MLEFSIFVLDLHNINSDIMKTKTTIIIFVFLFVTSIPRAIDMLVNGIGAYKGYDVLTTLLFLLLSPFFIYLSIKKYKEEKKGLATEDEMSMRLKYKSGYYAYVYSVMMWMLIYFLKDIFPNTDLMLGIGIVLSILIGLISKLSIKRNFNEESN